MDSTTEIIIRPIGVVHSEHREPKRTPIQSVFAVGCRGTAEIFPEYAEGLLDVETYSHLYLLYRFHRAEGFRLKLEPYLEDVEHGVFSTRAPFRPNHLGLSIVRMIRREGNILHLEDVDILDGTPLLDIKPYTARFDVHRTLRNGWQDHIDDETAARRGRREYRTEEQPEKNDEGVK